MSSRPLCSNCNKYAVLSGCKCSKPNFGLPTKPEKSYKEQIAEFAQKLDHTPAEIKAMSGVPSAILKEVSAPIKGTTSDVPAIEWPSALNTVQARVRRKVQLLRNLSTESDYDDKHTSFRVEFQGVEVWLVTDSRYRRANNGAPCTRRFYCGRLAR